MILWCGSMFSTRKPRSSESFAATFTATKKPASWRVFWFGEMMIGVDQAERTE